MWVVKLSICHVGSPVAVDQLKEVTPAILAKLERRIAVTRFIGLALLLSHGNRTDPHAVLLPDRSVELRVREEGMRID
jgi:hypothetical protein